jgi:preprotein translocase subunit SecG
MVTLYFTLTCLFLLVCLFMILLILIQKGRGGGLSGAFGGAGGNTAFGSKTGDVLTWTTSIVFGVFLLLAVLLNLVANRIGTPAPVKTVTVPTAPQSSTPAPAAPGGPVPAAPSNP